MYTLYKPIPNGSEAPVHDNAIDADVTSLAVSELLPDQDGGVVSTGTGMSVSFVRRLLGVRLPIASTASIR
ncbi:hypothetical protein D3C84_1146810 [compost metagenome]